MDFTCGGCWACVFGISGCSRRETKSEQPSVPVRCAHPFQKQLPFLKAGGAISVLMSQAGSQNGINDNWVWLIALSLSHSLKDLEALPGLRGGRSARITLSWMGVTSLKRKSENKHLVFTQLSPGERE